MFFYGPPPPTGAESGKAPGKTVRVNRVIDGDTVELTSGERVRYVGIDTPERGEPFYIEAKQRNMSLTLGLNVRLVICVGEPRDKYGRLLGWVRSGGVDVAAVLLREGLARVMVIPPCGLKKRDEFKGYETRARQRGLGIWE